jgi:hypothetical protein
LGSPAQLFWGIVFSSVGLGYFIYGKKQQVFTAMACGLGLMIYPYFVSDTIPLVAIGETLSALPFFIKL